MYNKTSLYIELEPEVDEEDNWTGKLEVNIHVDPDNPLKRDSLLHLTHLTELVACCVAYMEDNPNFYEVMEDFLQTPDEDGVSIEYDNKIENSISKIEGNVVTLSFKSNTKGSA
tara:strand:- start:60 stop:401 length:342 start_codon:yes stop_codon:yes gene_type:complete